MTKAARHIGVVGTGVYLPTTHMTAKEVAEATGGRWAEADVVSKLGFTKRRFQGWMMARKIWACAQLKIACGEPVLTHKNSI